MAFVPARCGGGPVQGQNFPGVFDMSVVVEEVQPRPMVDVLRELAEVMEANSIRVEWCSIRQNVVKLFDDDFLTLFAGQAVMGTREHNSSYVKVQVEKFGFTWEASLWRPVFSSDTTETIQL